MNSIIDVDGSFGESGGQIIRTGIGLSAVTGKPVRIFNIRKGRPNPGLKAQHMKGIEAVAKLCNAEMKGLTLNSTELEFIPGKLSHRPLEIDIGTAGSITLVLQTLMIPAVYTERELVFEITGGTNVAWSPTIEYFQDIFCDFMRKMGINIHLDIIKYGFYPKGGGAVKVSLEPGNLKPVNLTERGKQKLVDARSIASVELERAKVAERQIGGAEIIMRLDSKNAEYVSSYSPGSSIHLCAEYEKCRLGASALGERGKPAERVGEEAASLLKGQIDSGACLDQWMADQAIPYLGLARNSRTTISKSTNHLLTNIWITEKFLPIRFDIKEDKPVLLSVR